MAPKPGSRDGLMFLEGDSFHIEQGGFEGLRFVVVSVDGNEAEVVDQQRNPWDIEYDEHSMAIYPADYGAHRIVPESDVHFKYG